VCKILHVTRLEVDPSTAANDIVLHGCAEIHAGERRHGEIADVVCNNLLHGCNDLHKDKPTHTMILYVLADGATKYILAHSLQTEGGVFSTQPELYISCYDKPLYDSLSDGV
jgi:hypothetical protein